MQVFKHLNVLGALRCLRGKRAKAKKAKDIMGHKDEYTVAKALDGHMEKYLESIEK